MDIFGENKRQVIWGKLDGQDYVVQEMNEMVRGMTY